MLNHRLINRSALIPPQSKDYGLGIPACLAKYLALCHLAE